MLHDAGPVGLVLCAQFVHAECLLTFPHGLATTSTLKRSAQNVHDGLMAKMLMKVSIVCLSLKGVT